MILPAMGRRTQSIGARADLADAVLAIIRRSLHAFAEAAVTLKQVVEDQADITLGFRRKLNSEPHVRGVSL